MSEGEEMPPAPPVARGGPWDRLHERLNQQRERPGQIFREALEHVIQRYPAIGDSIAAYTELLMDHMLYLKTKCIVGSLLIKYYQKEVRRLKQEIKQTEENVDALSDEVSQLKDEITHLKS